MKKKKIHAPRYEVRCDARTFYTYKDKEWAIHSAECYADFFRTTVEVIDTATGEIVATSTA